MDHSFDCRAMPKQLEAAVPQIPWIDLLVIYIYIYIEKDLRTG